VSSRDFRDKRNVVILILIFFVSFLLLTVNIKSEKGAFWFQSLVMWAVSPVQSVFARSTAAISGVFNHYFYLSNAARENEALHAQVDHLSKENIRLLEMVRWRERVGILQSLPEFRERKSVVASVIGRDASKRSKVMMINRGATEGVQVKDAVVTDAGIVGHVIQVSGGVSKVLLLSDTRSSVDALFQDSRVSGVVVGTGENFCNMKFVPVESDVPVGSAVLTSGLGGIFPKGLMIGVVSQVKSKRQGLFKEVTIDPSVDLNRLEEVLVLLTG
jgi:rod shape-determining protein MreC